MLIVTILCTAVLVVLDQLAKYWAVQVLLPAGSLPFIPGVLEFHYVENTGAAFSLLAGRMTFLVVVTAIALLAVAFVLFVRRPKDKLEVVALVLILAGGLGNWIDRALNGFVVDYFNLLFMRFAVFNLADCFVCVGFALLIIAFIRLEIKEQKAKKEKAEQEIPHGDG